ncbi:hypothetical protein D3C83_321450 [compost metagenome]
MGYLNKDVASPGASTELTKIESAPPMEHLEDDERKELENVLQDKSKNKTR